MRNPAEEFVFRLCTKTFLSLWSYPNPQRPDGRELCDILVVCDPDIVIISVKDVSLKSDRATPTAENRWQRRAIEASAKQIYGAEKELGRMTRVIRHDGQDGLPLPSPRKVHRIAVALGSRKEAARFSGDFGNGYVHVFDESVETVFNELDTVADLLDFLAEIERFFERPTQIVITGGLEDLLGVYLSKGRRLPDGIDLLLVEPEIWDSLVAKPEFRARKEVDRVSYFWDSVIEELAANLDYWPEGPPGDPVEGETVVRTMARENRFSRRMLSRHFVDWHLGSESRARILLAQSGVTYVFLKGPTDEDRGQRRAELAARCFVARGLNPDSKTVVGLATEIYDGLGHSFDAVYLHLPVWSEEHQREMMKLQNEAGLFREVREGRSRVDEFPSPADSR